MMKRAALAVLAGLGAWTVPGGCDNGAPSTASGGELEAVPPALDFGRVRVGETGLSQVVLVNASWTVDVVVSRIEIEPVAGGSFSLGAGPAVPEGGLVIAPRANAAVGVTFAPEDVGEARAVLAVASNASNGRRMRIDLRGEGITCESGPLAAGEFVVNTDITWGPADHHQENPAVAFDGTTFMVVWEDGRSGSDADIYGTRIGTDGAPIDPRGFRVSAGATSEQRPAIASGATEYLVVWGQSSPPGGATGFDVYGARVSRDGVVLDAEPIAVCAAPDDQLLPSVAFDGTNYLVTWLDNRESACDVYGARVDPSGNVLDPAGIAIAAAPDCQKFPGVAFGGGQYLVVWQDHREGPASLYGARVDPSGRVLDRSGIRISDTAATQTFAAISFDGERYFVVWENPTGGDTDILGVRVDLSGAVLDAVPLVVSAAPGKQGDPVVGFDGTHHLVAWTDARAGEGIYHVYAARVDRSGNVLDPDGIGIGTAERSQLSPALASGRSGWFVAFADGSIGWMDVVGTRVGAGGEVIDAGGVRLSVAPNSEHNPSVASADGSAYFVAWSSEDDTDSRDIHGALVRRAGPDPGVAPVPLSEAPGDQDHPSVASDGRNYLVVWMSDEPGAAGIHGCLVDGEGAIVEPGERLIRGGAIGRYPPGLAYGGDAYLVVWVAPEGEGNSGIRGTFVDPSGTVREGTDVVISSGEGETYQPTVAFGGNDYLVAWGWKRTPFDPMYVVGRRVSRSGEVLNSAFLRITGTFSASDPAVAYGGGYWLAMWRYGTEGDIHGVLVAPDGRVLDEDGFFGISTAPGRQSGPVASFDGSRFLAVWEDGRAVAGGAPGALQVYGARVSPDGSFTVDFAVSSRDGDAVAPAVGATPCGESLAVYSGWAADEGYFAKRVFGRFFGRR